MQHSSTAATQGVAQPMATSCLAAMKRWALAPSPKHIPYRFLISWPKKSSFCFKNIGRRAACYPQPPRPPGLTLSWGGPDTSPAQQGPQPRRSWHRPVARIAASKTPAGTREGSAQHADHNHQPPTPNPHKPAAQAPHKISIRQSGETKTMHAAQRRFLESSRGVGN